MVTWSFLATTLRIFRAEPPFRHFWSSEKASLRVSFPAALPAGVLGSPVCQFRRLSMPAGKCRIKSMISPITRTGHRRYLLYGGLPSPYRTEPAAVPMAHADRSGVAQRGPVASGFHLIRSFGLARLKITVLAESLEEGNRARRPTTDGSSGVPSRNRLDDIFNRVALGSIRAGIGGLPLMPRLRYICFPWKSPREASLP